ncbi:MAG: chitobiase/beta-hexosaminidase C-terminal domain-containing protein [Bacteroidales bacterium]|nr:chitobiase/beta-hexosaminidase C-terminal domain-containing protein [Bacteroidales bacterium]
MKRIMIIMLLAVGLTAAAQEKQVNLGLIPTPQQVTLSPEGKSCVLAKAKVKEVKVDTLPVEANMNQAYQLVIEPKRVTLRYTHDEGLQNGRLTLAQLRQLHETMPCCIITDWPAYKYRGWLDDQSRGPVPHAAYRQRQWQTLHALKYNFCNYYTEHTLYQPEFPDLAPVYLVDCQPHPDEVINLQLFAHAEETLKIPFYEYLKDSKANYDPGNPKVYEFLRKRIAAAFKRIPLNVSRDTRPPFFIINCDETEQLGTGRAKKLVDEKGADQVYVDFINRCYEMVKSEGTDAIRLAMWGDIVAKNPEMMRQLPKDMTYIMWAYEPIDSFRHLIAPFKNQGNPFWVAASTGHSATMTSTPQRYIKNIANLYRDGYRDGAEGAMLTCWDDNGEALFDNSWHAQYWAAEMAWNPIKTDDPEELKQRERQFNENFERLFYGAANNPDLPIIPIQHIASKTQQLYAVGALMYDPDVADWYTSAALLEPLLNFNPDNISDGMSDRCDRVMKKVVELDKAVDSAANPHAHYALMRIRQTVLKSVLRKMIYHQLEGSDSTMAFRLKMMKAQYMTFLTDLKREYLHLWDQENGDYERYIVMNRYDDLAREVLELDRHVFMKVGCDAVSQHPTVTLRTISDKKTIYYTLDGSEPTASSTIYEGPFPLERSATIKAVCYNKYGEGVISEQYLLSHLGMGAKITLNTQYSTYKSIYSGGGDDALIDGQLGSNTTYADGHWQGYWGDSIDAVIDFGKPTTIHEVSMRFMQNTFDWILAPMNIKVYASNDGNGWTLVADKHFDMDPRETGMRQKQYTVPLTSQLSPFTHLRVVVPNPGPLPSWHPAPGQPSYLFTDEIEVH